MFHDYCITEYAKATHNSLATVACPNCKRVNGEVVEEDPEDEVRVGVWRDAGPGVGFWDDVGPAPEPENIPFGPLTEELANMVVLD